MENNNKKVPKLRFPGFNDDWEQRKLSDEFAEFIVPMRDKPKEFGGSIPWTRIEDIEGKYLNGTLSGQYVTEDTVKKMNLKIIPKDSLIVSSSATFGVVAVVTQDLITNQTFIGLVPKDKDTLDYWYSYFQSGEARRYMKLQSAGSTIFYISRESFENMPIALPSKEEAIKIGEFLTRIDETITLHQCKLSQLQEYKKGILQKMFPKEGESVPEIRFPGFDGDWEQKSIGEICERITRKNKAGESDLPLTIASQYGLIDQRDFFNKVVAAKDMSNYYLLQRGEFAYNKSYSNGFDYGSIKRLNAYDKGCLSTLYICFAIKSDCIESDYLEIYFDTLQWYSDVAQICAEGARNHGLLNVDTKAFFSDVSIIMPPTRKEQRMISEFLNNLTASITLHQRKLDQLKEHKKGLLQQMFV